MPSQVGPTVTANANGGNSSTTGPFDTTGATLLLVSRSGGSANSPSLISDTFNNTWHATTNLVGPGSFNAGMLYAFDKSGGPLATGPGHTVTVATDAVNAITFSAFKGTTPNQVNPLNSFIGVVGQAVVGPTGKNAIQSLIVQPGAITPPGGCLIATVSGIGNCIGGSPLNISSPFTIAGNVPTVVGLNFGNAIAFSQAQSPVNPSWNFLYTPNPALGCVIAAQMAVFNGAPTSPIFLARRFQLVKGNSFVDIVEMGFDFSQSNSIMVKVDSFQQLRGVKMRSVFIDLSQSDSPITITDNVSGANVLFLGRSQGWVPLMFNEPMQFSVAFNSGLQTTRILLRFSSDIIQAGPWRTG